MLTNYPTTLERTGFQNPHQNILPKMANLFINQLLIQNPESSQEIPPWLARADRPKTMRIPLEVPETGSGSSDSNPVNIIHKNRTLPDRHTSPIWQNVNRRAGIRTLVRGISHHFNNLLMGIWGNLSLARLYTEPDSLIEEMLDEMESLIEDGAYLTHLILGYLGERRIFAQRVRLKQLTQEVQTLLKKENPLVDMMGRLEWTTLSQKPVLITGCTGLIFEQFLEGIKAISKKISYASNTNSQFILRLKNIDNLVGRGLVITHRMRCSTKNISFRKRWINLKRLVLECADNVCNQFPSVKISFRISENLPRLLIDRKHLKIALEEIMKNACEAMAGNSMILEIHANRWHEEPPEERSGINTDCGCIVLTVKDNGKGIAEAEWKNIFKPFFTYPPNNDHIGLGLTVAQSVVRSHGGYIQVRSKYKHGSTFKIFLSLERR